jgi:hypothetical protein
MRRRDVERFSLVALMIWALSFAGANCGSAKVQGPQTRATKTEKQTASPVVTLTDEHPGSSLPVAASVLSSDSEVLEVSITKVVNPSGTPVAVFVYLFNHAKTKPESEKILIGNFSLYPPDQPGKFLLSALPALRKLSAQKPSDAVVRIAFELQRLDETKPWTHVEVAIAQPSWRPAEK